MEQIIVIIHVFISLGIIGLVLVQHGKDYKNSVAELRSTMASLAAAQAEAEVQMQAEAGTAIEPKLEPKLEPPSTLVD